MLGGLTAACLQIKDELLELLAAACILIASRQGEVSVHMPSEADFQKVTGYTVSSCSGPPDLEAGVVTRVRNEPLIAQMAIHLGVIRV